MKGIKKYVADCKKDLERRGLKRIGHCSMCGDCCEHHVQLDTKDIYICTVDKYEGKCEHFNKETRECDVPFNKKVWICKCWPIMPEHAAMFPKCTYKFVKAKR